MGVILTPICFFRKYYIIIYTNTFFNIMTIKLKDHEIELIYSIRTMYIYEQQMEEPLDYEKLNRLSIILALFYCNILATLQANKITMGFSWDDFIAFLDENGGYPLVFDYLNWFNKNIEIQSKLIKQTKEEKTDKKKKK